MKTTNTKIITLIISMFLIVGCGGEGSSDEVSLDSLLDTVPDNISPVANVNRLNVSVIQGQTVTLDASNSTDEDGSIVSYLWQLANGTNLGEGQQLSYNTSSLKVGTYKVRLIVTDDAGATGVVELTLTINERPAPVVPNNPVDPTDTTPPVFTSSPTASVSENQTSAITLVATDETSVVTYSISGTDAGSFTVNASTGVVTFNMAPDYETKDSYTFTAKATDTSNNETIQTVTITILDIECENPVTHNGTMYCTVVSPYTGKVWLDRNLGAARVCESYNDTACYGDYYQWGRNYDGHEDSTSGTTTTQATDVNSAGNSFIIGSIDWASVDGAGTTRTANWSATDGSSVCPVGFRVPNITELRAETLDATDVTGSTKVVNRDTAFSNFLKFPSAGDRGSGGGSMYGVGSWGVVWSSSASGSGSSNVHFGSGDARSNHGGRAGGFSVRCLRD
jgi:hypothetical protein